VLARAYLPATLSTPRCDARRSLAAAGRKSSGYRQ
jgi:hypothetical protein